MAGGLVGSIIQSTSWYKRMYSYLEYTMNATNLHQNHKNGLDSKKKPVGNNPPTLQQVNVFVLKSTGYTESKSFTKWPSFKP